MVSFLTRSHYIAQAGLVLTMVPLCQPPECWYYKHVPPSPLAQFHYIHVTSNSNLRGDQSWKECYEYFAHSSLCICNGSPLKFWKLSLTKSYFLILLQYYAIITVLLTFCLVSLFLMALSSVFLNSNYTLVLYLQ